MSNFSPWSLHESGRKFVEISMVELLRCQGLMPRPPCHHEEHDKMHAGVALGYAKPEHARQSPYAVL